MSKTTAVNNLPYPEDTDAPDGPAQIKALAELLDTLKWGSRNLKPSIGMKGMSADSLELTTSYQDIEGCKLDITPAVSSNLFIVAAFDMQVISESAPELLGAIKVDAEAERERLARLYAANGTRATTILVDVIALTAAAHTIKLRTKRVGGAGKVWKLGTGFGYLLVAS